MERRTLIRQTYKQFDKLILLVLIGLVGLFIVYPIVSIVAFSFRSGGEFSLTHYQSIFSPANRKLIWHSLWTASSAAFFSTVVAVMISLSAVLSGPRWQKGLEKAVMISMISPPFVSSLAFIILFGRRGLITYGLLGLSLNPYGPQSIVLLQALGGIAFASLLLFANLEQIDLFQVLASRDLGAKGQHTLKDIIFPALRPGILSAFFVLFTMNIADFSTPIIVGGSFKTLATEAYLIAVSTPNLGQAAAISVLMVPSALIAFYFYRRNMRLGQTIGAKRSIKDIDLGLRLPGWLRLIIFLPAISYFIITLLKYGVILVSAFANTSSGRIKWTLDYARTLPPNNLAAIGRSVGYSLIAALAATIIGLLISWYTHRRRLPLMEGVEFLTSLPYIIPGTFFGLGYVAAFSSQPLMLRGTAIILITNYCFRQLSVPIKAANTTFSMLDRSIDRAAKDLGASELQTFWTVLLSPLRTAFINSFITVFTSSMMAVGAIAFIVSPGRTVASMELFRSVGQGRYGLASFQAVLLIVIIFVFNLILLLFKDRKGGRDVSRTKRSK
ncbi:MAG TPA: iron ABC transporter permease [Tissierellia bacterium]|nr:iron ABC transporter permease [Tissierellia bacterium]